jgi:hypothetical protein
MRLTDEGTGVRDEVDDLVDAWRRQRPDLDVEPLQVLSRVSRLASSRRCAGPGRRSS